MTTQRSPRSHRWDLMGKDWRRIDGKPFISRLRVIQTPWFSVLLSRIHTDDNNRDPHNHSRPFITIALTGSYMERYWDTRDMSAPSRYRYHRRWHPYLVRTRNAHQIIRIKGKLRTLVLAGRHHGTFYFWTANGPVDYREYK